RVGQGQGRIREGRQDRRESRVGLHGSDGLLADQVANPDAREEIMKRLAAALLLSFALAATLVAAQAPSSKPLDIYVVDTEGGKAALFVSPTGQSLLIDS